MARQASQPLLYRWARIPSLRFTAGTQTFSAAPAACSRRPLSGILLPPENADKLLHSGGHQSRQRQYAAGKRNFPGWQRAAWGSAAGCGRKRQLHSTAEFGAAAPWRAYHPGGLRGQQRQLRRQRRCKDPELIAPAQATLKYVGQVLGV